MKTTKSFLAAAILIALTLAFAACGKHDLYGDTYESSSSSLPSSSSSLPSSSSITQSSSEASSSSSDTPSSSSIVLFVDEISFTLYGLTENDPRVQQWKTVINGMHNGWKKHINEVYLGDQAYFTSINLPHATGVARSGPRRIELKISGTGTALGSNHMSLLFHEIAHVVDIRNYYSGENSIYKVNGQNFYQIWNSLSSDERFQMRGQDDDDGSQRREGFAACVGRIMREIADGTVGKGVNFIPPAVRPYIMQFVEDIETGHTGTYEGVLRVFAGEGNGTAGNPYIITISDHIIFLADAVNLAAVNSANTTYNTAHYRLGNNIVLSGNWTPIGISSQPFSGVFDGNGKIISGLTIASTSSYQGLFGIISSGTVKNLGLENIAINGDSRLGGIAGDVYNSSTISNCYTTGTITGQSNSIGGIVGRLAEGSIIENCYSTVTVSGGAVGGIAGSMPGSTVKNCAALNPRVAGTSSWVGRVNGNAQSNETRQNNIAFAGMLNADDTTNWSNKGLTNRSGLDLTAAEILADGTLGGRFTTANGWTVQNGKLPGFGQARDIPEHLK
jgi:hypothetical protein